MTKNQPIIIGLTIALVFIYFAWVKYRDQKTTADTDTSRPSEEHLPRVPKQNDKVVVVDNISYADLQTILTGFCNMYNKESYQALPRLTKITEQEFAITFPYDIDFEIFCYLINYICYPMGFDQTFNVVAWTTTNAGDIWITEKSAGKKAMLYIPADDTEHDNVFMTTADNICYKLGFAVGEEKKLLNSPKKQFTPPTIDVLKLATKEYKDFK